MQRQRRVRVRQEDKKEISRSIVEFEELRDLDDDRILSEERAEIGVEWVSDCPHDCRMRCVGCSECFFRDGVFEISVKVTVTLETGRVITYVDTFHEHN